jgi:hypothetical protein
MDLILNQINWDELKTKLRKKYPQLTDADLQHKEGMEDMLRMVEYKLGKTKLEMREIIAGIGCSPYSLDIILHQGTIGELKKRLRKKYPQLTDTDLLSSEGDKNDMLRMIEYKLRKTKQEMQDIIERL